MSESGLSRMPRGREHVRACGTRLAGEDGLRGLAQPDPSRPGLGVGEVEAVAVDLRPSELQDLALPAAGEQEQPDDVGLWPAGGPLPDQPIEDAVKPFDLFGGEEAGEFRARVLRDALDGSGPGMAGGEGGVHDLAEDLERLVGSARSGAAVGVEPPFDVDPPDGVQREAAEGGDQLPLEHTVGESAGRRGAAAAVRRQPLVLDEVAEQGSAGTSFRRARGVSHAERQGSLPGVLDGHERGRADGRPDRLSLDAPVPDEAAMPGRAYPHAEAGHLAVPDRVFRRVRLQLADARVGQPDPPPLHARLPERTGDRVSNASRTVASDRWAYFRVVAAFS